MREQLVTSRAKTYGDGNPARYITVHETANRNRGADAAAHANLQSRGNVRNASWHVQVDDTEAVRSFPDTVRCWHAGDGRGSGNMESLAIEICVNSDGDYEAALRNAAEVIRAWRKRHGIPRANVVQHNRWSGKNCPTILRGRGAAAWAAFVASTDPGSSSTPSPSPSPSPSRSVSGMATEVIRGDHGNGHDTRRRSLGVNAGTYAKVRAEVNRRLAGGPSGAPRTPSVSEMATEVIRGAHGNGHANRRRSLGINAATYAKVRAEVNRRLR